MSLVRKNHIQSPDPDSSLRTVGGSLCGRTYSMWFGQKLPLFAMWISYRRVEMCGSLSSGADWPVS